MEIQLVEEGQMQAGIGTDIETYAEEHTTNIEEFEITTDVRDTIYVVNTLIEGGLGAEGYDGFISFHPRYGRDVAHFVKGVTVIAVDYIGNNILTMEVLPEDEAISFVNNIDELLCSGKARHIEDGYDEQNL